MHFVTSTLAASMTAALLSSSALAFQFDTGVQDALTGVVISEIGHRPNGSGGQFIEIFNGGVAPGGDMDLSGWVLLSDSGAAVALPTPTIVPAQRFLVVDLAGGSVSAALQPEAGAYSVNTIYNDDFFPSGFGDALTLIDSAGDIRDGLIFAPSASAVPNGSIAQLLWALGEWNPDGFIADSGLGAGFSRKLLAVPDSNGESQWQENRSDAVTPGLEEPWTGEENRITGRVFAPDFASAATTVSIDSLGLSATTDALGFYELSPVPEGAYTVMYSAPGCIPTWERIADKAPHRSASMNVKLEPIEGNAITRMIDPAGTTVIDPDLRFAVIFPPGFVDVPTELTFSHVDEASQPRSLGSLGGLATQQGGSLYVYPHVASATPGVEALVGLQVFGDYDQLPLVGSQVLVETMSPDGIPELMSPGYVDMLGLDKRFSVFSVPHFCHASTYLASLIYVGPEVNFSNLEELFNFEKNYRTVFIGDGGSTADVNGDGDLDAIADVLIAEKTICGGACWEETVTEQVTVTEVTQNGWGVTGGFEAEPGWLAKMVADAKISIGGSVSGSSSSTTSTTVTVTEKVKMCAEPEKGKRVEVWAKFRKINVWIAPYGTVQLPADPGPPAAVVLIPLGVTYKTYPEDC